MHVVLALALRRVALVAAGLASVLAAHAVAVGEMDLERSAPVMWGFLLLGAGMCGGRRRFLPRSYASIATLLVSVQTLLHVVLVAAPWSLGLSPHHHPLALIDVRSLAVHAVAALLLAILLRRADLVLAVTSAATRVVARTLADRRRPSGHRHGERVRPHIAPVRRAPTRSAWTSRGPPRGSPRPAEPVSSR